MERPAWAPPGIDISVPSVSRMYDFYLGGSHNFEVDREAARKAMEFIPGLPKIMQANRAFMRRAVRHAVDNDVTQFLDIGSGIPTFGNVHEVARAADPAARVVYVDHDPVAVAHSRAVLHFLEDEDRPYEAVAELIDALAPGSLLVLTHASYEGIPLSEEQTDGTVGVYRNIRNPLVMRSGAEIGRFFEGTEMVEPGLVPMPRWRPESPVEEEDPYAFSGFAGVGRKA